MNKSIKFWLLICLVAILMVILSIFVIYKYQIHFLRLLMFTSKLFSLISLWAITLSSL